MTGEVARSGGPSSHLALTAIVMPRSRWRPTSWKFGRGRHRSAARTARALRAPKRAGQRGRGVRQNLS